MKVWDGIIDVNQIPKIPAPKKKDVRVVRSMVAVGTVALLYFVFWFFQAKHIGHPVLFWVLAIAIGFKLLRILHEWYHYSGISIPEKPLSTREWSVDMFTTFVPGEPYDMIEETLEAMVAIRYPHQTYLCDEGNDPYLKELCDRLGVHHVYRGTDKTNAKAGNVNYALSKTNGEIAVVLDPDHIPSEEFLDRVLPYFEKEEIGYVQSIQAYYNRDESFIAKGAAEQTYTFYGPMMMSMNRYGTVQAIGANCAFRRKALDSIGGHAAGLSEDMHTAMQLHAKGWKSIYVPEALTRGQVPATMSAYYKQQLKWTRGSLDLLFNTVPGLIKNFTWAQTIHYLTLPLYFLFGLIALIDLSIPIISLFTSEVPWLVEMDKLLIYTFPLLVMILVIRQFSQRWMLEAHERGMHFLGGTLMLGSWWVFLIGFIYTIFRIKVPYIPTPKNDEIRNEWRLSIPNLVVMILSLVAIVYGLSKDWSPYMLIMAGFAMINTIMLGLVVLMGQQKMIKGMYDRLYGGKLTRSRVIYHKFRQRFIYRPLRSTYLALAIVTSVILGSTVIPKFLAVELKDLKPPEIASSEGAYVGLPFQAFGQDESSLKNVVTVKLPSDFSQWNKLHDQISLIVSKQHIPMIIWEPWNSVDTQDSLPVTYRKVADGNYDDDFLNIMAAFHGFKVPLYFVFAPNPDKKRPSWDNSPGNEVAAYHQAWEHLLHLSTDYGLYNLVWFEQVYGGSEMMAYKYRGFIPAVTAISGSQGQDDLAFEQRLQRFIKERGEKPDWILGLDQRSDHEKTSQILSSTLPDLQGIVWSGTTKDQLGYYDHFRQQELAPFPAFKFPEIDTSKVPLAIRTSRLSENIPKISIQHGTQDGYSIFKDGSPFYIRGVAYNPSHDWRDGFYPLTRTVVEDDFERMKALGANTIRRYSPGIYDRNILSIAGEKELNVLYGFWFDPEVDYFDDLSQVAAYKKEVIDQVKELKDEKAILAWGIGNETWGLLKHHFRRTYLPTVRMAYLNMLEELASEIKRIDPNRPVFSALEHSPQVVQGLTSFRHQVPSLDFIAVNSYYDAQISMLDSICQVNYPGKPYLVSEFGPEGYWDIARSDLNSLGQSREPTSYDKGDSYYKKWTQYIEPNRPRNLGGVAFCWRDRMEETICWFGLTDNQGRIKPAYQALHRAWNLTGNSTFPVPDVFIPQSGFPYGGFKIQTIIPDIDRYANLQIEWLVRKEHILKPVKGIEVFDNGRIAWLDEKHLDHGTEYRVYITVSDSTNKYVSWSSLPIYYP